MSAVYPLAVDTAISAMISGSAALGPIKAVMVDDTFEFNVAHDVIGDIDGTLGSAVTATVAGISGGVLSIDPLSFTGVAEGETVRGVVFYLDGNDLLLCHVDHRADLTPINVETDGGVILFTFDRLMKL